MPRPGERRIFWQGRTGNAARLLSSFDDRHQPSYFRDFDRCDSESDLAAVSGAHRYLPDSFFGSLWRSILGLHDEEVV